MRESEPRHAEHADDLTLIETAAREAGEIAMRYFRRDPEVWMKAGDSPVSAADLAVDGFLRSTLLAARPDYGWLSEETVDNAERLAARRTFVVDPIDGTRAFIDGRKVWCISIAVVEEGRSIAGVLDCPASEEIFTAAVGSGAWMNGGRISVRTGHRDIAMGGPKSMINKLPPQLLTRITPHGYIPSLAYRIALVARGTLDATFVRPASHDWDLAAADLLLSEAGGQIIDASMRRPLYAGADPKLGSLAAGSGDILRPMAKVLAELPV